MTPEEGREAAALADLLRALARRAWGFVTISPRSHAFVAARGRPGGDPLRDLLGWSFPVAREELDAEILDLLEAGGALEDIGGGAVRSRYRISSESGRLYLHSAWPTLAPDSVFFGPDSYRFAACIRRRLDPRSRVTRLVEIGAGSGVGAITAAGLYRDAEIAFTDINPAALRLASINAAAAGVQATAILTSGLDGVAGRWDLIVSEPSNPWVSGADPPGPGRTPVALQRRPRRAR